MMYRRVLTLSGRLLPAEWRDWAEAMAAELEAIPAEVSRARFAMGCVHAILLKGIEVRLRSWFAEPWLLVLAIAAGGLIAVLDRFSGTRVVMWFALLISSALFAWYRPIAAWRWGLLLSVGIPALAATSGMGGPYAFDRGDAFYGLPPATLVAILAAYLRRRRRIACLALAVTWSVCGQEQIARAQSHSPHPLTPADIADFADSVFADYLRHSPQPSLAFVVVKDDAILFARGYGSEDPAGTRPVDPDSTLFWLASLSKLITTEAVMRERDRGHVALEAPITQYLDGRFPSRSGWPQITVEDLLRHTSGLDEPFMLGTVDDPADLLSLSDYLLHIRWRAGTRPGDVLRYSNHGMALAGRIVERTSGTPFAEYVEREIFAPMKMNHATFRQPVSSEIARRIATAGTDERMDYLLPAPAGAMVGTPSDMGRFLVAQWDTAVTRVRSLEVMHATHWRAHRAVPGVALGWFETDLGGVRGLYHTGARHHFSVAWIAPSRRVGVFLVHSMRQGGPYQLLRSEVIRGFVQRYLSPDLPAVRSPSVARDGVYRPMLLSTTTMERAGDLFLDTPVRSNPDGSISMRVPGGLGVIVAQPIGDAAFEVTDGPHAGLRIGFLAQGESSRIAIGGTLLDPLTFTRLSWWERGVLHGILLGVASSGLVVAAVVNGVRSLLRRRRGNVGGQEATWTVVTAAGLTFVAAFLAFGAVLLTTPEVGAASHMRHGLCVVLVLLSFAAVLCVTLPILTVRSWRRDDTGSSERVTRVLLSAAGVVAAVLLWHYHLLGFQP